MSIFTGTRCMVCNEKFGNNDDIVVCPDCGTPYHRECYLKNKACVNTLLHESGRPWQPMYDVGDDAMLYQDIKCKECSHTNPPMTLFCESCGNPLAALEFHNENVRKKIEESAVKTDNYTPRGYNQTQNNGVNISPYLINYTDRLCGYNPEEDYDGVKLSELGDYVDTNTHYYLPLFKRFKETSRNFSWNLTAMLFPELFFANRKMPLAALLAVLVRYIVFIPFFIEAFAIAGGTSVLAKFASQFNVTGSSFQMLEMLVYVLSYSLMFFCGSHANSLYYKKALKKIKSIKQKGELSDMPPQNVSAVIVKKGGTSGLWLALFICLDALPYLSIWCYNALSMFFK